MTGNVHSHTHARRAMRDLLGAARTYYIEAEDAMAEVERILALDDEELASIVMGAIGEKQGDEAR